MVTLTLYANPYFHRAIFNFRSHHMRLTTHAGTRQHTHAGPTSNYMLREKTRQYHLREKINIMKGRWHTSYKLLSTASGNPLPCELRGKGETSRPLNNWPRHLEVDPKVIDYINPQFQV